MKTHCLHGHLRTPENLDTNGSCKTCKVLQGKAKRAANRFLNPKVPKTHCPKGHPRTPENLGERGQCKVCRLAYSRAYASTYREAHHEESLAHSRKYYAEHKEECAKKQLERLRRNGVLPMEEFKALRRANRKTHCDAGHPLDPAKHGCKVCEKEARARARELCPPKPPKTQCRNGHPENRNKRGQCKACRAATAKRKNTQKKARLALLPKYCKRGHLVENRTEGGKRRGRCRLCTRINENAKHACRRARKTGAGGSYTLQEERTLRDFYGNRCICCGRTQEELSAAGLRIVLDHVVPVSKGGTSFISNLQPLCHTNQKGASGCNEAKCNFHDTDYRVENMVGLA